MNGTTPVAGCVALTGATGFVGGHILRQLVDAGWRVKALTRRSDGLADFGSAVTPVVGSLESQAALTELVTDVDAVVHCAGLVAARRRRDFDAVNRVGTARLVDVAAAGTKSPQFVLISSLAAREPQVSPYAESKRLGEDCLRRQGEGLDWQILRPPVVYGPGDRATFDLFRQLSRGFALLPRGDGRFSMIYVEDLAAGVVALLQDGGLRSCVAEVHDGRAGGYSWDEMLAMAEHQLGRPLRGIAVPRPLQRLVAAASVFAAAVTGSAPILSQGKVNEIAHPDWVCRNELLDELISWQPRVGFEEGFSKTLAWYKAAGWL
ncbi:NAD(P)H-binding protein [Pelagibius litoralis]|uniref:NAD(P)H-binding protein n=1 Tax=Pelagibius litoralis TaxID=374515 RepID=A0A967KA78_9PROT|nr:NAD-dependent epimerase/dehydratase family protein [Pelagibius litoralis]NIA71488.1 NAD(P)H-binding protein [Pelagibius litoralis]